MRNLFTKMKGSGILIKTLLYCVLIMVAVYTLIPLVTIGMTAARSKRDVFRGPFSFPSEFRLFQNFIDAWTVGHFGLYIKNSVIITFPTVLLVVSLATLGGYAFAKISFRGRSPLFYYLLVGMMIPFQAVMIPLYFQLRDMHLLGTYWSVILTIGAFGLPFGIFMMRAFFRALPMELVDAAKIDGCSEIQAFWHVMMPLAYPAWICLIIFQSMWTWNNFLIPLLYIHEESMRPLPLGLMFYQARYTTNFSLVATGNIITILPLIILFIVLQRHFISGITMGALKQ